jgi:hypothetical protein
LTKFLLTKNSISKQKLVTTVTPKITSYLTMNSTTLPENTFVQTVPASQVTSRGRGQTKTNEDADIDRIITRINEHGQTHTKLTDLGDGKRVIRAYRSAGSGNRKIHYDFCVDVAHPDGSVQTNQRVEHKGSNDKKPIDPTRRLGVQFHNGSPKLTVMTRYLTMWYNHWIASGRLTEKYGIQSPVPSLEEWLKRDAMVQGDPKTAYGKELKRLARERNGLASSLTQERDEFMETVFTQDSITVEDLDELKKHVLETANHCLQEKDLWLQIAGNIHGTDDDYYHLWTPKMPTIEAIDRVDIKLESKKNVEFVLECRGQKTEGLQQLTTEDAKHTSSFDGMKIVGIMRWGKGQGFSNFRFDLK